ncbi:MAG: sugar kinase [bacterium]|nr:sugar kinase [bacterium]
MDLTTADFDVVTLGETMIRLSPPLNETLETARQFDVHIGGSEANTAVGLARLGLRVAWLSRLTDNPLGRSISGAIARFGVDTRYIAWTAEDRVGTYYYEPAVSPRVGQVIYDRAHSAFSKMQPTHLPADLFETNRAKLLHLTGITPAVGAGEAALAALERAKRAGWRVSFDFNYRAKLWALETALAGCEPFMRQADILFISRTEAQLLYHLNDSQAILDHFHRHYPQAFIVLTMGSDGAAALRPDRERATCAIFPAQEIGRLGRGDAFSAGVLYGYLSGFPLDTALRWGAACAALKSTTPGDLPLFTLDEVRHLAEGQQRSGVNR